MKSRIGIIWLIIVVLLLSGCNGKQAANSGEPLYETVRSTKAISTPVAVGETLGDYAFVTMTKSKLSSWNEGEVVQHVGEESKRILVQGDTVFYVVVDKDNQSVLMRFDGESTMSTKVAYIKGAKNRILYSEDYLVFEGSADGYGQGIMAYSLQEKTMHSVGLQTLMHLNCGLYKDKLWIVGDRELKSYNLIDGSYTEIFVKKTAEGFEQKLDSGNLIDAYFDEGAGYLYYFAENYYYEENRHEKVLMRYDFASGQSSEMIKDMAETTLYPAGGKLYAFRYNGEEGAFLIEGESVQKISSYPCGQGGIYGDALYYTAKEPNTDRCVLLQDGKETVFSKDQLSNAAFVGIFDGDFWFCGTSFLQKWNSSSECVEGEYYFNGTILSAVEEEMYIYGRPIEKRERVNVKGESNTTYEKGEEGIYKVNVNETQTEEKQVEVFLVTEEEKKQAAEKLDAVHGTEILILVRDAEYSFEETTYEKGVVSIILSGTFRIAKDSFTEGNVIFSINTLDGTTSVSGGSVPWSTIVSAYKAGI